jgi:hypothetical protein
VLWYRYNVLLCLSTHRCDGIVISHVLQRCRRSSFNHQQLHPTYIGEVMTETGKHLAGQAKRTVIDTILLLLLCVTRITDASPCRNSAFVSQNSIIVRSGTVAFAAPGMSDERRKQERDAEIRSTIAKLKREGKIKNKDGTRSAEDSAMLEAEAFFNRTSPVRKFEQKLAERKRLASVAEDKAADDLRKRINDQ